MNRRIETRVVYPTLAIPGMLIEKSASEVYFITIHPEVWLTAGTLQIFDGFDAAGKLVWESRPGQNRHYNFIPPIPCEQGVYILVSNTVQAVTIHCYAVAWRPKKWDRLKPHPLDVIELPRKEVPA